MDKLLVLNWKMNPCFLREAEELAEKENQKGVIICAPYVYLHLSEISGAQNMHQEKKGAHTGAISGNMLKDLGIKYVLIGHSELNEEPEIANKKARLAIKLGLIPIVCIAQGQEIEVKVKNLKGEFIIAYEPAEEEQPQNSDLAWEMSILIRKKLRPSQRRTKILYGGDVTLKNCLDYHKLDGLLLGQASLNYKKFLKIYARLNKN